jgi:hypothetical protein
MMKQRIFTLIAVGLAALLLTAGLVLAKTKTPFSGDRNDIVMVDFGDVWSTGNGDKIIDHGRDRIVTFQLDTDDDRVTGTDRLVVNFNQELTLPWPSGPIWGTFKIFPDNLCTNPDEESCDGFWEGTMTGDSYANGYWYNNYVGHGTGVLAGLKLEAFIYVECLGPDGPFPPARRWLVEGYILDDDG